MDSFDRSLLIILCEFDERSIQEQCSGYMKFLDDLLPTCLSVMITTFMFLSRKDSLAKDLYEGLVKYKLVPINYEHESIFLVHILSTNESLALQYVQFMTTVRKSWPDLYVDFAMDNLNTRLINAIKKDNIEEVSRICSIVGPNGIVPLNRYFSGLNMVYNKEIREKVEFMDYRRKNYNCSTHREELEEMYNHKEHALEKPRLERQITMFGSERLKINLDNILHYINPCIPIRVSQSLQRQKITKYLIDINANVNVCDEIVHMVYSV